MENYIVKFITPHGSGSGFFSFPFKDKSKACFITARHVILDDGSSPCDPAVIKIEFADQNKTTYQIASDVLLVMGSNNESEDIAAFIIPASHLPEFMTTIQTPGLIALSGKEINCLVIGYPKLVDSLTQRTLYNLTILSDKDHQNQIQSLISDPVSDHYNSGDLLDGYSGSPLFLRINDQDFAFGIFHKYEGLSKRLLAINLHTLNNLFLGAGIETIELEEIETNPQLLADIKILSANTTRVLARIRTQIASVHLERTGMLTKIKNGIIKNPIQITTGKPGTGKSALVKDALTLLNDSYEIIALQGEQLDRPSLQTAFSSGELSLKSSLVDILDSKGLKTNKILVIDSLEKILETENTETILEVFGLLTGRKDITLVLTCRSYAVDQLKIRFFQQFPPVDPIEIPLLTDAELSEVTTKYPAIGELINKPALKELLRVPFNLDKASAIIHSLNINPVQNETDFKRVMWEYIIEGKDKHSDINLQKNRAALFSQIAVDRARQMTTYVTINESDEKIIQQLINDSIIERHPTAAALLTPAHDILEDWALTRFIDEQFHIAQNSGFASETFLTNIGYSTAIRRALRIWISDSIQQINPATEIFITEVISGTTTAQYWKDEITIAIMQSAYSNTFLTRHAELLLQNDAALFKRCLLLLKVACQQPDLSLQRFLKEDEKNQIYRTLNMKPVGEGWTAVIEFIYSQLTRLQTQFTIVIPVILQWHKGLSAFEPLPPQARPAGLVLVNYFTACQKKEIGEQGFDQINDKYLKDATKVILQLSPVLQNETKLLLENALSSDKKVNRDAYEFWSDFAEVVLQHDNTAEICISHPKLVLALMQKHWFYVPPTAEEWAEMHKGSQFHFIPREIDNEEKFGVPKDSRFDHFPSGSFTTPIIHLLNTAMEPTLEFICAFFKHSVDAYLASDYLKKDTPFHDKDIPLKISYELPDGTPVEQYGSLTLWLMYRGTYLATPYVLQSVLMGLEEWFFINLKAVIKPNHPLADRFREKGLCAFDYLLKNSSSVATTSVLASLTIAHPEIFLEKFLPVLKVKEIYQWDLRRQFHEKEALAPLGVNRPGAVYYQKLRFESNQLPHRKKSLENIFLEASFTELAGKLIAILDEFYAQKPLIQNWHFMLNRMDRRKLKAIGKQSDTEIIFQTQFEEELLPQAKVAENNVNDMSALAAASNWAHSQFKDETVREGDYQEWQKHYQQMLNPPDFKGTNNIYFQPRFIAAVGIQKLSSQLSEQELEWCVNSVFELCASEITASNDPYDMRLDSKFGAFEIEPCYAALVDIIAVTDGEIQQMAKEWLFLGLVWVHNDIHRKALTDRLEKIGWKTYPGFVKSCLGGMIEFAALSRLKAQLANFNQSRYYEQTPALPKSKWSKFKAWLKHTINWLSKTKQKTSEASNQENEFQRLVYIL
jgi:hypothetical protein